MCPETPLGPPFCSVGWWDGDGDEEGAAPSVPRSHSQSTGMGTPSRKTAQRQVRDLRDGIPEGARDSRWLWGQHGTDPRPAPLQHSPTCGFPQPGGVRPGFAVGSGHPSRRDLGTGTGRCRGERWEARVLRLQLDSGTEAGRGKGALQAEVRETRGGGPGS